MTNSIAWLILLAVLLLIEIITLGLTTIWFAGGALVAFIVSLFYDNLLLEIIIFLVISVLLLYFTRPYVIKYFNPKRIKTNYEGLVGKEALVIMAIDNIHGQGQVIVDGQEWTARSSDSSTIDVGARVIVQDISGVKLIVKNKEE